MVSGADLKLDVLVLLEPELFDTCLPQLQLTLNLAGADRATLAMTLFRRAQVRLDPLIAPLAAIVQDREGRV